MLIELHAHTYYSHGTKIFYDGVSSPEEMVKQASKIGLNAIAITDHNSMVGAMKASKFEEKYNIMVIPGEEVSTLQGHVLAIGIEEFIRPELDILETLDKIHEQGGIAIAPHPFDIKRAGIKELAKECDAVEVFNSMNIERIGNNKCKSWVEKNSLPIVAGSDAHMLEMIGYGLIKVKANSLDEILKAIKKGKTKITTKYVPLNVIMMYSVNKLKLSYDYTVNYMEKNYCLPKRFLAKKLLALVKKSPGKIDNLFKIITYIAFGSIVVYSSFRNIFE